MPNQKKQSNHRKSGSRYKQVIRQRVILAGLAVLLLVAAVVVMVRGCGKKDSAAETIKENVSGVSNEDIPGRPDMDVDLLSVNEYSRPGTPLEKVNGIVMHYTANPGSNAKNNRNYFENLQNTQATKASSHFVVGLDGEIVQCIPTAEIAYASNERNSDTIAIENCHPDETGQFNDATYESMVNLTAWLCKKFDLGAEQVIRHYDVTGKDCPKYFVDNEEAWEEFRARVADKIKEL